jgi:hypothetical protein
MLPGTTASGNQHPLANPSPHHISRNFVVGEEFAHVIQELHQQELDAVKGRFFASTNDRAANFGQ